MIPTRDELEVLAGSIEDAHRGYVANVSAPNWAVSTLCAAAALYYCNLVRPSDACDLGSGFTSYTLRWWAEVNGCKVTSVDDSPAWLSETAEFLKAQNLDTSNLYRYDEWTRTAGTYDLIVHDLAQGDLRDTAMWVAARRLNSGGVILFDDAQHDQHNRMMRAMCDEFGFALHFLDEQTRDGINRYCAVAVAP